MTEDNFELQVNFTKKLSRLLPAATAVVALDDVHVDQVLQLLHLGQTLPGVVREVQVLDLAGRVEAQKDGVEDVQVDQGARLVGMAVGLLCLIL